MIQIKLLRYYLKSECWQLLQGERLIKLAEMCRRLETEEEKVLPFYASSLTAEEREDVDAAVAEPPNEKLAEVIVKYCSQHAA